MAAADRHSTGTPGRSSFSRPYRQVEAGYVIGGKLRPGGCRALDRARAGAFLTVGDIPAFSEEINGADWKAGPQPAVFREDGGGHALIFAIIASLSTRASTSLWPGPFALTLKVPGAICS